MYDSTACLTGLQTLMHKVRSYSSSRFLGMKRSNQSTNVWILSKVPYPLKSLRTWIDKMHHTGLTSHILEYNAYCQHNIWLVCNICLRCQRKDLVFCTATQK